MEFSTLFASIQTTVMDAIEAVVPVGLAIFGTIYAIKKGAQLIKSLGK
ncbi:MAG: hypothetical protein ACPLKS_07440 [Caldisericum exile]